VRFKSPSDAIDAGIGMVHQHFMLADNLTVLENVVLGRSPTRAGRLDTQGARRRITELSTQYGLGVRPDAVVEDLGVGDRQRVEILKVLYRGARVLILDEPTAVLVPQEVDELFASLDDLRAEGVAIVFISHKLDEVLRVADAITVLRAGTTVATVAPSATTPRQLAELMVGSELPTPETRDSTVTDEVVLDVRALTVRSPEGRPLVDDVSLTVHRGEVLGIAGVEGNGQVELVEALLGLRASTGTVRLGDRDLSACRPASAARAASATCRRTGTGRACCCPRRCGEPRARPPGSTSQPARAVDRPRAAKADTERIVREYGVRTPGIGVPAFALSGGNQQKLVIGREMSGAPSLLGRLAPDPGRRRRRPGGGLGTTSARPGADGLAVLLVSADLESSSACPTASSSCCGQARRHAVAGGHDARGPRQRHDGSRRMTTTTDAPTAPARSGGVRAGGQASGGALRGVLLAVAAPLVAAVFALLVSSLALLASGNAPLEVYAKMLEDGTQLRSVLITINNAVPLYLAGIAVAIGFRMALFNIGVEGQYSLAALLAAAAGAAVALPGPLHIAFVVVVAMAVGAAWAGVAGLLKTTRGVSEVISTIMLNVIAGGLAAYLLSTHLQERVEGSNNTRTARLPESAHFPDLDPVLQAFGVEPPQGTRLGGFLLVAVVVGVLYALVVDRSRFGFELRATGLNPSAAVASGVDAKRMTLVTMLLSGAVAGLVGLAQVLGTSFSYGLSFTAGARLHRHRRRAARPQLARRDRLRGAAVRLPRALELDAAVHRRARRRST
jgi:simple sugar transport system ATP-binding protein